MITNRAKFLLRLVLSFTLILAATSSRVHSAAPAAAAVPSTAPAAAADAKPFKPEELEALVANIALYPDAVLAQVFMASTYPLEIVQAERWVNENKDLKGQALTAALEKKDWDPSVKSLVNFPQVLTMMSKQLEWTAKLGDAFIADQAAVMAAVQRLRAKARDTGNLKDTPEQKVIVEQPTPQTVVVEQAPPQIIRIESTSPEVVYVPTYSPTVVYGTWPYAYYPPYPTYYPPGYVASNMISFGVGVAVGAAWGYAWGGCHWHGGEVDIDVDRNTNINRDINRESHRQNIQNRQSNRAANRAGNSGNRTGRGNASSFQHDPSHRKGVSYRDQASARQVNAPSNMDASRARQQYRGRAETGRQDIARGAGDSLRGGGRMPSNADRAGAAAGRGNSVSNRSSPARTGGSSGGSAFSGSDRSGSSARSASSRGQSSRSSASPSRSGGGGARSAGGSRGGGSRGGGGMRGGGGRGGGGGRR